MTETDLARAPAEGERLDRTLRHARALLLEQRTPDGVWRGELSSSALSTATAVAALALTVREQPRLARRLVPLVRRGRAWLAAHANPDGGFGDTVDSPSNLATTALVWSALGVLFEADEPGAEAMARDAAKAWVARAAGATDGEPTAERLAAALAEAYGADRTFAVPILVACATCGVLGSGPEPWRAVPRLPYELAALPQRLFRFLRLPVVSYALPALIAIGQAIEHHRPSANPVARLARSATRERTLATLRRIQPSNGGFLEATPLTSFVLLSLLATGRGGDPAARRALSFLVASARTDGSWPIDTDLATWVTTLAIGALAGSDPPSLPDEDGRAAVRGWLLDQQLRRVHPYTGAAPGGWAWTDLPGGVPDADDTAGALLALRALREGADPAELGRAAAAGVRWLVELQNADGGIPTFCRGWGRLPFDRSSPDLTAHALCAWHAWDGPPERGGAGVDAARARRRAIAFLVRSQRVDGAWVPLWFGNQAEARLENPVYGTSRVLRAAHVAGREEAAAWRGALARGTRWLLGAEEPGGGFGGGPGIAPSVEETALALEGLADAALAGIEAPGLHEAIGRGAAWLAEATREGVRFPSRPIGLYFARLWYAERLYPLAFTVSALGRARRALAR